VVFSQDLWQKAFALAKEFNSDDADFFEYLVFYRK